MGVSEPVISRARSHLQQKCLCRRGKEHSYALPPGSSSPVCTRYQRFPVLHGRRAVLTYGVISTREYMNIKRLLTWVFLGGFWCFLVFFGFLASFFVVNSSLFGSQGSVSHLFPSLLGGSFTETLKGVVKRQAGPACDFRTLSYTCCRASDGAPPSIPGSRSARVCVRGAQHFPVPANRPRAEASNAQAAFPELEKRVSSFARALKMHMSLARICPPSCPLLGGDTYPCS